MRETEIETEAGTWTTFLTLNAVGDERADKFHPLWETLNFEKLSKRAISIRRQNDPELPVTLNCGIDKERFAFGRYNIVFTLRFTDDVQWVARIPFPNNSESEHEIRQEVAIINLIRAQTTIPAPAIHDYNAHLDPDIGARYILMDRLRGDRVGSRHMSEEQCGTFARQFASCYHQLSKIRFPNIGGITHRSHNDDEYAIEDQVEVDSQASTRQDTLQFLYEQRQIANREATVPESWTDSKQSLAAACQFLMQAVPLAIEPDYVNGPFPLKHMDMHSENILVDDDCNITGIIDWSSVRAVPLEIFASHPMFITYPGLSDEENAPIVRLRTEVATEFRRLAEEAHDPFGLAIANLIGTVKAELADRLLTSPPHMVMVDAKIRVLRLVYGKNARWEDVEKLIVNGPFFQEQQACAAEGDEYGIEQIQPIGENCAHKAPVLGKREREESEESNDRQHSRS